MPVITKAENEEVDEPEVESDDPLEVIGWARVC